MGKWLSESLSAKRIKRKLDVGKGVGNLFITITGRREEKWWYMEQKRKGAFEGTAGETGKAQTGSGNQLCPPRKTQVYRPPFFKTARRLDPAGPAMGTTARQKRHTKTWPPSCADVTRMADFSRTRRGDDRWLAPEGNSSPAVRSHGQWFPGRSYGSPACTIAPGGQPLP